MFADGTVRAYSLTDGHQIWQSKAIPSTEYPNNVVPTENSLLMIGGNLYVYAGYSSQYKINPIPRFAMLLCINATTGDITWTLNGGIRPSSAANGFVIGTGDNDGNIYSIGKGPTSTTVAVHQQMSGSLLIQGSVLDTSPASYDTTLTTTFANGVPAVSDSNMSVWMDYLHMQNSTMLNAPPQCIGVPVTLTAVDPNNNTITIGTTTSDDKGNYGLQWTPTMPGVYHIYATFAGSDSYYTSSASTYATVGLAASSPVPSTTAQVSVSNSDMLMYLAIGIVAIIIAIAVATVLIIRKK
jgi:outer membrane protein assembly factor BamB